MTKVSSAAFSDTKPHYELLDGLRGVAALLVVFYLIILLPVSLLGSWLERRLRYAGFGN